MCHAHSRYYACRHTSVKWLYCPDATFDLETGHEGECSHAVWSGCQPSTAKCPLRYCKYAALQGSWTCCRCGGGPNDKGWCEALTSYVGDVLVSCGHGCCSDCTACRDPEEEDQVAAAEEEEKEEEEEEDAEEGVASLDSGAVAAAAPGAARGGRSGKVRNKAAVPSGSSKEKIPRIRSLASSGKHRRSRKTGRRTLKQ